MDISRTIASVSFLLLCVSAAAQAPHSKRVTRADIFFERLFGPSEATLVRRSMEHKAATPGIASADTVRDGSLTKYIHEHYPTVEAYDTPGASAGKIETDVRFLCDPACSGRATGTAGLSSAEFYIYRRFKECGLETRTSSFRTNGKPAHNIIGVHRVRYANKWVIVMARMDGVGDHAGNRFPGADANASGVAAMISLADRAQREIIGRNMMYVALDGHGEGMSGAQALWSELKSLGIEPRQIAMVINLEEIGTDLVPPVKGWNNYLIALGGERYERKMWDCNGGLRLQLHFDYYGSKNFTDLFYRRASDHKVFLENGCPCVMFTSGITLNTNRPTDTPNTLNYELMDRRVSFIMRWIKTI